MLFLRAKNLNFYIITNFYNNQNFISMKKFIKYLLFGAIIVAIGASFVACYDHEALEDRVDALERLDVAGLKTQLDALQTEVNTLKGQVAQAVTDAKNEAIAAVEEAIEDLEDSLPGMVQEEVDAALEDISTSITAIEGDITQLKADDVTLAIAILQLQVRALELHATDATAPYITQINGWIADLRTGDMKVSDLNARLTDLADALGTITNEGSVVTFNAFGAPTHVELIPSLSDFAMNIYANISANNYDPNLLANMVVSLPATISRTNDSFPVEVYPSNWNFDYRWTFTEGQLTRSTGTFMIVQVNPSNAVITKEMVSFVDGTGAFLDGIEVTKVERYAGKFTRAAADNGLWKIDIDLAEDFDRNAFDRATTEYFNNLPVVNNLIPAGTVPTPYTYVKNMYALSLNTGTSSGVTRYVNSRYDVGFYALDMDPIYNWHDVNTVFTDDFGFFVKADANASDIASPRVAHTNIHNRFSAADETGAVTPVTYAEQRWVDGWGTLPTSIEDQPAGSSDDRQAMRSIPVVKGVPFEVTMDKASFIWAYYVTLDFEEIAVESSPSEWNAWMSYKYTGLNQNAFPNGGPEGSSNKVTITVDDGDNSSVVGDYIGFRVHAVNYDGTVVDPDGKAFYVRVDPVPASETLNFVVSWDPTINTLPVGLGGLVRTNIIDFPSGGLNLAAVDHSLSTLEGFTLEGVTYTIGNLVRRNNTTEITPANWTGVTKLQLKDLNPTMLRNNFLYTDSSYRLVLRASNSAVLAIYNVTLIKPMPTEVPPVEYKTNIWAAAEPTVLWAYPRIDDVINPQYDSAITDPTDPQSRPTFDVLPGMGGVSMMSFFNNLRFGLYNGTTHYAGFRFVDTSTHLNNTIAKPVYDYLQLGQISQGVIGITDTYGNPEVNPTQPRARMMDTYTADLGYGYGYINFEAAAPVNNLWWVNWVETPVDIQIKFRSFVQDFEVIWNGDPIELQYNAPTNAVTLPNKWNIRPIAGIPFGMDFTPDTEYMSPDGPRTYTVVNASIWTGPNFDRENEYFIPEITAGTGDPNFGSLEWVPTQQAAAGTDVPGILKFDIMDEFGHVYRVTVPGEVLMIIQGA